MTITEEREFLLPSLTLSSFGSPHGAHLCASFAFEHEQSSLP
jgi:hypothetical protein